MLLQRAWKQFSTFTMLLEDWARARLSELQPNSMKTESGLCYGAVGLFSVPVLLSCDPLGFWRLMLSVISLQGNKKRIHEMENLINLFEQSELHITQISLPDASLVKYFGPAFLNDVVHQVPLWNSLLRLPVFLKGFHLGTQNSSNILPFKNIQVFRAQLSSTVMLSAENTQNKFYSQITIHLRCRWNKKKKGSRALCWFTFT